jgi:hypothetical protein
MQSAVKRLHIFDNHFRRTAALSSLLEIVYGDLSFYAILLRILQQS